MKLPYIKQNHGFWPTKNAVQNCNTVCPQRATLSALCNSQCAKSMRLCQVKSCGFVPYQSKKDAWYVSPMRCRAWVSARASAGPVLSASSHASASTLVGMSACCHMNVLHVHLPENL